MYFKQITNRYSVVYLVLEGSLVVVQGGWGFVRNGSPRSGALPIQCVGGQPVLVDCPGFEVGELLQPFMSSLPLVVHVFHVQILFKMIRAFFRWFRQFASMYHTSKKRKT